MLDKFLESILCDTSASDNENNDIRYLFECIEFLGKDAKNSPNKEFQYDAMIEIQECIAKIAKCLE